MDVVPEAIERFATGVGPETDAVVDEMDAYAAETGFPTVGPAVGGWLRLLARLVDAQQVFEFGSGFGYSAYWFAGANETVEVVCCEFDADNIERGREYLARGGYADRVTFEEGDALETIERHEGPFDVVLVDNEKHRYREAFEAVRGKVAPGGLVLADNAMTAGSIDFEALSALVDGEAVETTESTRGIFEYLETVREAPQYDTVLLPLGEGVAVSAYGGA